MSTPPVLLKPEKILLDRSVHYWLSGQHLEIGSAIDFTIELEGVRWMARDAGEAYGSEVTEIVPAKILKANPATKYMKLLEFPFAEGDNLFVPMGKTLVGPNVTTYDHDKWAPTPALALKSYAHRKAYAAGMAQQRLEKQQRLLMATNGLLRKCGLAEVAQVKIERRIFPYRDEASY